MQSAKPAEQEPMVQTPLTQAALELGGLHLLKQAPQLAVSPAVQTSQPSIGLRLQSA